MTRESAETFIRRVDAVSQQLKLVLANSEDALITRQQGELALERLRSMREAVIRDALPPRENRYAHLSRMIVDSWPLGSKGICP